MVIGTLWSVAMRWSMKVLGLLSTVALARILSPGDYGVVAMAMLVVGLAEVLIDFGASTALLREPEPDRAFIDSAWTLGALQGLTVAAMLALAAPLAGRYFQEPRVVPVILMIAPFIAFSSFGNIGIILARKHLDFALEFRFTLIAKLIGVAATLTAALMLRDFRALVIGMVSGYLVSAPLSYWMHPYRPRWCTARLGAMWNFSKWLLIGGIGQFAVRKADEIAAGRLGGAGQFGAYTVGADIGQLVTAEISPPIIRTLLPTLSALHGDLLRMQQAALKTLAAVTTIALPMGVGMALVAPAATLVLLGPQWQAAVPFVAIFAMVGAVRALGGPSYALLLVLGHSKLQAGTVWIEFSVFVAAAILLVVGFDLGFVGMAWARLASTFAMVAIYLIIGHRHAGLSWQAVTRATWRPFVGVALMGTVLPWLPSLGAHAPIAELAFKVAAGGLIYASWITASWWATGRPDGIERMVANRLGMS